MKIKILKDIPGFKAGTMLEENDPRAIGINSFGRMANFNFTLGYLVEEGWAEEVNDEIDIEAIRNTFDIRRMDAKVFSLEDQAYFSCFRIVKAVIEKLNGNTPGKWEIAHYLRGPSFSALFYIGERRNILPSIANEKDVEKVIELCKPELEVLFGVK